MEQEMDIEAQNADMGQMAQLMQQMAAMYGLQQQAQMDPEKLRALRAGTEAQIVQTGLLPRVTESEIAAREAGVRAIDDKIAGKVKNIDLLDYYRSTGQPMTEATGRLISPENAAVNDAARQAESKRKAALRAQDQAQQQAPVKAPVPGAPGFIGPVQPTPNIVPSIPDIFKAIMESIRRPSTTPRPWYIPGM